jgi:transcriptional regulator with XRE-family HTH domain
MHTATQSRGQDRDVERGRVLTRALRAASDELGLAQHELARVLGTSEASVSRLRRGRLVPYPSREAEAAALLVRLFRSLDALVGGDTAKARVWLRAPNLHLAGTPAERIQGLEGLVDVVHYLDAMRGHL